MDTPKILKCDKCSKVLDEIELKGWNRLVDYWGGIMGDRKPLCRDCYHQKFDDAKRRATL